MHIWASYPSCPCPTSMREDNETLQSGDIQTRCYKYGKYFISVILVTVVTLFITIITILLTTNLDS